MVILVVVINKDSLGVAVGRPTLSKPAALLRGEGRLCHIRFVCLFGWLGPRSETESEETAASL